MGVDNAGRISRNEIYSNDQVSGLLVNNLNNWAITDNRAEFSAHPNSEILTNAGIQLQNAHYNYLYGNSIVDVTGIGYNATTALFNAASFGNRFCCNTTEGNFVGSLFMGGCFGTNYRQTDMAAHDFGLWLPGNANTGFTTIGPQPFQVIGTTTTNNNRFGAASGTAWNDGDDIILEASKFYVTNQNTPHYPDFVGTPNGMPSDWFETNDAIPFECAQDLQCPDPVYPPGEREEIEPTDIEIAKGTFGNLLGGAALQWEGERDLYDYPAMLGESTDVNNFFASTDAGSVVKSYYEAELAVAMVQEVPAAWGGALQTATDSIEAIEAEANAVLTALASVNTRADSLEIYWQSQSVRQKIVTHIAVVLEKQHQMDSLRRVRASTVLPTVTSLPASNVLQSNRKDALRIYLEVTSTGATQLTEGQFDTISAIAHQCPLAGGSAVYMARTLYQLKEQKHFDDFDLCAISDERSANSNLKPRAGHLFLSGQHKCATVLACQVCDFAVNLSFTFPARGTVVPRAGFFVFSMKKAIFTVIGLLSHLYLFSQLHDNTWILGYPGNGDIYGHSILTFTDGSLQVDSNSLMNDMEFPHNNSSYSDEDGQLFAFFNGMDIRNKTFVQDVENGGDMYEEIDPFTGYYLSYHFISQGSIFLPFPSHKDSLILLYLSERYLIKDNGAIHDRISNDVTAAVINIKANNGLGKVVEREIAIVHDTLQSGKLKAVKHANGRDWWLVVICWNSKEYYRILINPDGIHNLGIATVDIPFRNGAGQCVFSNDGSKYVLYNSINLEEGSHLDIFDFDRCTGLLSNQVRIKGINRSGGVAFSSNSRFLYINKRDTAFQYDLHATDISASRKLVAVYDGFTDPFQVSLFRMQLAPDGKIYSSATNGTRHLHVIHRPDEEGTDCQYQQHGIQLYKYNDFSVPNFPNYRLGPLDGSPCDTLGLDNYPKAWWRYEQDTLNPLLVEFRDLSYYEPTTWSWDFGDGGLGSNERHPLHQFPEAGIYQVCLTVSNQYGSDTHCKTLYLGVSAQDNPVLQAQVKVWPNPFRSHLTVAVSNPQVRGGLFRLYDATGRLTREQWLALGVNEVETGELAAGMYFWEVTADGEQVRSGKCVKIDE
jgi:hypothetical protein